MSYRKAWMLALPVLWLSVLASAVSVIYARHQARNMFVHLEKLNAERDALDMEWGRLQLEQSVANSKLKMNLPDTHDVRIVRQ